MNNEIKFIERGWECPKCGAVMAPHMNVCINCKGNSGGTTITATELRDCVQRYYDGNDCYESVTPVICNGRADVIPTGVPGCGDFGTEPWIRKNNIERDE